MGLRGPERISLSAQARKLQQNFMASVISTDRLKDADLVSTHKKACWADWIKLMITDTEDELTCWLLYKDRQSL